MPVSDPAVIAVDARTSMSTCAPLLSSLAAGFGERKPNGSSTEKAGGTRG